MPVRAADNRAGPRTPYMGGGTGFYGDHGSFTPSLTPQELDEKKTSTRVVLGIALAGLLGLGYAAKDGLHQAFRRVGNISCTISNMIAVPFSLLFPFAILDNELSSQKQQKRTIEGDLFSKWTYSGASLQFAAVTWGERLLAALKSPQHMAMAIVQMPHMLFSLFSYTGGRLLGSISGAKLKFAKDDERKFRNEIEFNSRHNLGNIGSAQVSVIPMGEQCVDGLKTIYDIATGNFSSAINRFKEGPISTTLGTLFNSWLWLPEYLAKFLDTTIMTAEMVDTYQNAVANPEKSAFINGIKGFRDWWHSKTSQRDSFIGNALRLGREAAKIESLLIPPIGMTSVVTPVFDKFLRGKFWTPQAQEIGGFIGVADKFFNLASFFTHLYYTGMYATSVRLPQTITTATFYISHMVNWAKGYKPTDKNYWEPTEIRDRIFNWGIFKKVSDEASIKLDKTEIELHPDNPVLINDVSICKDSRQVFISGKEIKLADREFERLIAYTDRLVHQNPKRISVDLTTGQTIVKGTGRSRHIRSSEQVFANIAFAPVREERYYKEVMKEYVDPATGEVRKKAGQKPSDREWGEVLFHERREILAAANANLRKYLETSLSLDRQKIEHFMREVGDEIHLAIEAQLDDEINANLSEKKAQPEDEKIKSQNLLELFTNPQELWELLKLKTFHASNTILPRWINGFVRGVDLGKRGQEFWLRNILATESGRYEMDINQACNREFLPVVGFAFQSWGKGASALYKIFTGRFKEAFFINDDSYNKTLAA